MTAFGDQFLVRAQADEWDAVKQNFQRFSNQNLWVGLKPTKDETLEFLKELKVRVERDRADPLYNSMPSLRIHRADAIGDIGQWVDADNKSAFPSTAIHANRAAFQLSLRVLWPGMLNQGDFGFCGPTTILYAFAQRYPREYAKCGLDLIGTKTGVVHVNRTVTSFQISLDQTEAGDWKGKKLPEADFILLRAIRKKAELLVKGSSSGGMDFVFSDDPKDTPPQATTPGQIAKFMKDAGYSGVKDYTLGWPGKPGTGGPMWEHAKSVNMKKCFWQLRESSPRPIVIMLVSVEMADRSHHGITKVTPHILSQVGDRWDEAKALAGLHWIVVEELQFSGTTVRGRMVTWKKSTSFSFDQKTFLSLYHGYVVARP